MDDSYGSTKVFENCQEKLAICCTAVQETEDKNGLDEFPEGGRQGWATVFGSFCMVFLTQGSIFAFGVYQDFYTRSFLTNNTPSQIAWIGSVQLFLIFSLGLPTGKLFDEGYFRHLMIIGSAIYIFSYFMLSFAQPHQYYQVFLSQGVGVGIGMGLIFVPSVSLCFHYFKRRRALATGIATIGSAVGGICQTIGLNHLIHGSVGFAWGIRIFCLIFLVLAIMGNLVMRPRLPPRKFRTNDLPKPDTAKLALDIPLLIIILGASLVSFATYFPYFYLQLYAVAHGIPTQLAFYTITILNGSTILGRVVLSLLGDKYGMLNAIIGTSVLLGTVSFGMILATTTQGLIFFAICYGFFSGGYFALGSPVISAYVNHTNELGFALGYSGFIQSFFVLVAAPIAGEILDAPRYRWSRAIVIISVILFVGILCALLSRAMLVRRKNTWRI